MDDGQIKHDGKEPGYLYVIVDEIQSKDVIPHPQTTMSEDDEWLTTRGLFLQLLCAADLAATEQLTDDDYAMLREKLSRQAKNVLMVCLPDRTGGKDHQ